MKKVCILVALALLLLCALTSCDFLPFPQEKEDVITIEDGYLVVNGVKTEYKADQAAEGCTHLFDANGICSVCKAANPGRIEYSVSMGTKIDTLPPDEQELIDAYVSDCKTLYKAGYVSHAFDPRLENLVPHLSFTDVLVYDFRDVDENNMDNQSLLLWNTLKTHYDEAKPIFYVELAGYHTYFNDGLMLTPIQSGAIIYGFFIFEDETVIRLPYTKLCNTVYVLKFFEGTEFISCGDKYAEEFDAEQLYTWANSTYESGQTLQSMMKKLKIDE